MIRISRDEFAFQDVVAASYQGLPLNSPNDVAIHPDGSIFFTFVRASAVPSSLSHRLTMCAAHRSPRRSTTPRRC